MATGIEMMVSALLKAVGFSREQFDGTLSTVKAEFDAMKTRALNAEKALDALMQSQAAIIKHLGIQPETDDTRQGVLTFQQPASNAEKESQS